MIKFYRCAPPFLCVKLYKRREERIVQSSGNVENVGNELWECGELLKRDSLRVELNIGLEYESIIKM